MSLLGSLIGGFLGYQDDKQVNKMSQQQLALQQAFVNRQIDISQYIEELARMAAGTKGTFTDPYGGGATYDPVTKTWSSQMSPQQTAIQNASYQEELDRNTHDQQIRRQGLDSAELARQRSAGRATDALADVDAFKRGFGKVNEDRLASSIRADRVGAVNAGYDDAARAAQTLQLRTGNAGIGDAITALARNRTRDLAQIGNPEVEAMQLAHQTNDQTQSNLYNIYKGFNDEGTKVYDAQFTPSTYNQDAYSKLTDAMKFDLSKLDLAMGGAGNAASTIGNAASGSNNAFSSYLSNRIPNATGKFIMGADQTIGDAIKSIFSGGAGGFGGMSFGG